MKRSSYLYAMGIAAGLGVGSAAALASCVLPEFEVGTPPDAGKPDAHAPHEAGPTVCGATYPDPPGGDDTGADGSYVVAMRSIALGENTDTPPGFDLDGQCTCVNEAGPTCVSTVQQCDAPNGVDNTMASLIKLVADAFGPGLFGSDYFSTKANEGRWSALIQIDGYNGLADDPSVAVSMLVSSGFGGTDAGPPKWDGMDEWPVTAGSLDAEGLPVFKSAGAYVANRVLVAALPSASLTISGGSETLTINITGGVLTGKIQVGGGLLRLTDGVLAGRWREADVFKALSSYRNSDGAPLCTNVPIFYNNAKAKICANRDILADGTGAKSLPCDALSLGIGFTAEPAKRGFIKQPAPPTPGCPMAIDPAYDHCPGSPAPQP